MSHISAWTHLVVDILLASFSRITWALQIYVVICRYSLTTFPVTNILLMIWTFVPWATNLHLTVAGHTVLVVFVLGRTLSIWNKKCYINFQSQLSKQTYDAPMDLAKSSSLFCFLLFSSLRKCNNAIIAVATLLSLAQNVQ